jgi:hypothetical protein
MEDICSKLVACCCFVLYQDPVNFEVLITDTTGVCVLLVVTFVEHLKVFASNKHTE